MAVTSSLVAFAVAATLLAVTPGIDTALVLRTAAVEGPRRALLAIAGIFLGCTIWGAAAAIGLGALLHASELAYTIVKYAGAAYLGWLGAKLLFAPRRGFAVDAGTAMPRGGSWASFRNGLVTNLLNPKVGVFYVTFLPQFVPAGSAVATYSFMLALLQAAIGVLWLMVLVAATVPLGRLLARPAVIRRMDRVTGGLFIGFGVKLALSQR
ncbi:Threonine/homoserine/homoserine lactone efflux protein [Sphingomonas laterariae]|uniref:Threonine/homoserine/homoserine lactone efflux protein n=1 Tax=Edaphosphingomonas laterariae TaxID=861865 RepID=A0A239G2X7_9SPHN|nr:LysE family translocator [Sphingomonas laterariae]SNS62833.1 Threonine/homoserine/homoserine lactone efflux protein [Sphingomonas laterariae]